MPVAGKPVRSFFGEINLKIKGPELLNGSRNKKRKKMNRGLNVREQGLTYNFRTN